MGILFHAYIAIDDNTPEDQEVFTNDPSIWNLEEDYALGACGERAIFASLGYDRDKKYPPPTIPLRGIPNFIAECGRTSRSLETEDYITWVTLGEFEKVVKEAELNDSGLSRPVETLQAICKQLGSIYGEERIRLVFCFIP